MKSFGTLKILPELRERDQRHVKRNELQAICSKIKESVSNLPRSVVLNESMVHHFHWREMDFSWLVQHLLSPNPRIRGCHIRIPDTVFLRDGKLVLRVKSDNNNFLICYRNPKRLKKTEIRSQFPTITRERRKRNLDNSEIEDIILDEQVVKGTQGRIKITKHDQSSIDFNKGEAYKEFNLPSGKTLHGNYYRDIAIVQFYSKDYVEGDGVDLANEPPVNTKRHLKPMSENEFLKVMSRRPNDEYWKGIEYIQTCIKAKLGIGKSIQIDYYPKLNKRNPSHYIHYNFRKFKSDQYLMINSPKEYCLKQIVKM